MNSSLKSLLEQLDKSYFIPEDVEYGDPDKGSWLGEEDDDCLEEDNTTSNLDGGQGQPNTPYAFGKKVRDPDDDSYSEPVNTTERFFIKIDDIYNRLNEKVQSLNELNYKDYKRDDTRSERQKINANISEINKKLREVEQMINHASKLKVESGSDQTVFWKGTLGNFSKINERLIRLSNKIREMNT